MRMDYGLLKRLSLQSTSDQTDVIYNSCIAAAVAAAVTPEQAGMWVYPYEDEAEHVIYNMVNGLLLRPYISGMVWKLGSRSMELMKEGIALYKEIRSDIKDAVPVFPLGFDTVDDAVLAYGLQKEDILYLAVFTPKTDAADIPLPTGGKIRDLRVLYPKSGDCTYAVREGVLHVEMPQKKAARLFTMKLEREA